MHLPRACGHSSANTELVTTRDRVSETFIPNWAASADPEGGRCPLARLREERDERMIAAERVVAPRVAFGGDAFERPYRLALRRHDLKFRIAAWE